jgi:hypothetical protein
MTDAADTPSTTEATSTDGALPLTDSPTTSRTPDEPRTPAPGDKTALLQELVATIRASVAPGVTPEARAAGAAACRAILSALEAQVGQPLIATPAPLTTNQPTSPSTSPLARILSQFAGMPREQLTGMLSQLAAMPREQLVEFLLSRLRSAFPPGAATRVSAGPRFHLIQIPPVPSAGKGP